MKAKPNEQTTCRYCAIAEGLRVSDPIETVCPFHTRWIQAQQRERRAIDETIVQLRLGRLGLDVAEEDGTGYLTAIEPAPTPPEIVDYDEATGAPIYRDLSNPLGRTFRRGVDLALGGSDPRMDKLRDPEVSDDGE